jgi:cystathionine beta-lyase
VTDSAFTRIDEQRLRAGWGVKWGSIPPDHLGAWVADMDFGIPPAIRKRMIECIEREDFGYPFWPGEDPVVAAFQDRMATNHGWIPHEGRTRVFSDLIQVLQVMIEHATRPGDGIAVHIPTYPPFLASIRRSGRHVIPIPMIDTDVGWGFDTEGLTGRLRAANTRMLLLVNPHNPTGRVFTRPELAALAEVAAELDLVVLADEIHADLTYPGHRHLPFAGLDDDCAQRTITTTSATKAFNIAGLRCAVAHVGPAAVRASLATAPLDFFGTPGILSRVATVAAWRESDDWLSQLRSVLSTNRDLVNEWISAHPSAGHYHQPEATYLAWFQLAGLGREVSSATDLRHSAKVVLSDGGEFSDGTDLDTSSFVRLNYATSQENLVAMLERLRVSH